MRSKALRQIADAIRFLEWLEKLPPEDFLRGERCLIGVLLSLRSVEILQPQQVAEAFHGLVVCLGETLKVMVDSALFHDGVCREAGFDFGIDREVRAGDGAVPDIVIALAAADELAAVFPQNLTDFFLIFGDYAEILS